ncbi:Esterase/lipase superfamily enzyme [Methylocella tundrae]|uniref:Esterase/lipase superfamily enzyme n=1 Tax=Methylocella tundrae TaxID=227605 RepID=A0A8B6M7N9_METTU|nr:alpha/beta hydrolase [Methylocella tundrae]VTZ50900.1 Esterase/lipase superfamily enzyme [Methylocella tundrae]
MTELEVDIDAEGSMRFAALILVCGVLVGCGRPAGVLAPIEATVPNAARVDLLVATTRAPSKDPGILFSGERETRVALTDITVSIPPDDRRRVGQIQWPTSLPPNPETDFATLNVTPLTDGRQPQAWLKQHLPRNRRVLVFVHGFNNHFDDAVYQLAQIAHDSGADAAPILFTWPSRGNIFQYVYDRESTNASRDALEEMLRNVAKDPSVGEITVMAHSMGSWLVMEALRQMSIRDGRVAAKVRNVILASPDVDVDVFATQWRDIGQPRPRLTVFTSRNDAALRVSRRLAGDVDRLGQIDPMAEPYHSALEKSGIDVIDLSALSVAGSLNHSKFAENPEIVQLIGKRLIAGQTLSGSEATLGERVGGFAMGVGQTVGGVAGVALSAPIAVVDPNSRRAYDDQLKNLGDVVDETVGTATDQ